MRQPIKITETNSTTTEFLDYAYEPEPGEAEQPAPPPQPVPLVEDLDSARLQRPQQPPRRR